MALACLLERERERENDWSLLYSYKYWGFRSTDAKEVDRASVCFSCKEKKLTFNLLQEKEANRTEIETHIERLLPILTK